MSGFSDKVALGRTGLMVSRIGVGSSYGPSPRACHSAFDAGVNYFFWGSIRTRGMGYAVRELAQTHRDELVIVLESYTRGRWTLRRSVERGLRSLGIDYADVLLLGWHDRPMPARVLEEAARLREQGKCRFLAMSSHQRPLIRTYVQEDLFDAYHLRYSAAHPGAEVDIFPHLPDVGGPGIVSFTNTRWGTLLKAKNMPAGETPPSAADCYRFVLSDPHVHVAITGPKNDQEMEEAISVLDTGPMDDGEMQRMRTIGAHVHEIRSFMAAVT
jgi:aryl-alcohol dehydrogenase-like predicted oxidoreductase